MKGMNAAVKDARTRLEELLEGTPADFQAQVNSIVDEIEEAKWNDGWDDGYRSAEQGGEWG